MPGGKAGPVIVDKDEHPRPETTLEGLSKLKPIVRNPGTVTAGNASGVNDGTLVALQGLSELIKRVAFLNGIPVESLEAHYERPTQ